MRSWLVWYWKVHQLMMDLQELEKLKGKSWGRHTKTSSQLILSSLACFLLTVESLLTWLLVSCFSTPRLIFRIRFVMLNDGCLHFGTATCFWVPVVVEKFWKMWLAFWMKVCINDLRENTHVLIIITWFRTFICQVTVLHPLLGFPWILLILHHFNVDLNVKIGFVYTFGFFVSLQVRRDSFNFECLIVLKQRGIFQFLYFVFQGFFIFYFHSYRDSHVRNAFRKILTRSKRHWCPYLCLIWISGLLKWRL